MLPACTAPVSDPAKTGVKCDADAQKRQLRAESLRKI
jgi:hypothetical protein